MYAGNWSRPQDGTRTTLNEVSEIAGPDLNVPADGSDRYGIRLQQLLECVRADWFTE